MISILIVLIVLIWAAPPISRQNPILPYPVSFLAKIFRPTHRPPHPPTTIFMNFGKVNSLLYEGGSNYERLHRHLFPIIQKCQSKLDII